MTNSPSSPSSRKAQFEVGAGVADLVDDGTVENIFHHLPPEIMQSLLGQANALQLLGTDKFAFLKGAAAMIRIAFAANESNELDLIYALDAAPDPLVATPERLFIVSTVGETQQPTV